jgi:hypothetical protein
MVVEKRFQENFLIKPTLKIGDKAKISLKMGKYVWSMYEIKIAIGYES